MAVPNQPTLTRDYFKIDEALSKDRQIQLAMATLKSYHGNILLFAIILTIVPLSHSGISFGIATANLVIQFINQFSEKVELC